MSALELEQLGRDLGERTVLRDISLELPSASTLVIFGPNGAGKTTLLRILATLLQPHSGSATVLGKSLPQESYAVRAKIGLLAHESMLYRNLSARENLRYYARLRSCETDHVEQLLETVHLSARADEPVRTLSRGMIQRIAVCRCALHQPSLLLLDEPYAHMDPAAATLVEPLIGAAANRTRVLITHDVTAGLAEADFVLGLHQGRQQFFGPTDGIDEKTVKELYQ